MIKTQLQGVGQNKLPKWPNPACQSQVSCSQFVIYCYQAAALDLKFGSQPIAREILQQIPNNGVFYSLKSAGGADLVKQGLNGYDQEFQQSIPQAMRVDAKTTSVDQLLTKLKGDNKFQLVGYMVTTKDKTRLRIVTTAETAPTWDDVWKIVG